ncbi:MAG TPA: hypothetical protein VGS18_00465, partial [Thermoplasmata archaeon]|nr:hypothetical protein [Thermoplasmata archaeon]
HDRAEARRARDAARGRVQEALVAVREFRSTMTRGTRPDPATLQREIAALEHRQQTHALPLPEENALLARLRKLTQELGEAERDRGAAEAQRAKLKELEGNLAARRAEFDGLTNELPRLKSERERRMESIRARLVDEGAVVASLREAARRREAAFERLQAIGKQIDELEQEGDRLLRNSKARRQEARHVLQEYNRSVRGGVDPELAQQRSVDGRLEELLKRGKVVLR